MWNIDECIQRNYAQLINSYTQIAYTSSKRLDEINMAEYMSGPSTGILPCFSHCMTPHTRSTLFSGAQQRIKNTLRNNSDSMDLTTHTVCQNIKSTSFGLVTGIVLQMFISLWRWYTDDWFSLNPSFKFFHWSGQENAPTERSSAHQYNLQPERKDAPMSEWEQHLSLYNMLATYAIQTIFYCDYNLTINISC